MKPGRQLSVFKKYQYKWVILISLGWAIIDSLRIFILSAARSDEAYPFTKLNGGLVSLRFLLVWSLSAILIYVILLRFKAWFQNTSLIVANLFKGIILCISVAAVNVLIFFILYMLVYGSGAESTFKRLWYYSFETPWLLDNVLFWILVIVPTQLLLEINEKYSPGVFLEIFMGKYIYPKEEERIIMFIDLKDSTPIAEQLGHKRYFLFIRDFIHYISTAILEYNGRIYQYVGDEVVVSWNISRQSERNKRACIQALIAARKLLQQENNYFRQQYNIIPEFRVGMHAGKVMVGEIGVIKKDLAMSGDAMNTAARIRSATGDLKHRFIMSKDFVDLIDLKEYQAQSLGQVDLKGKDGSMELFSLHI